MVSSRISLRLIALPMLAQCMTDGVDALPALQKLNINSVSISGISSGADMAAQFAVAYSDILAGSAIFAGQPFMCAVQRFSGEPELECSEQKSSARGPGCVGYPDRAQCLGCDANMTLLYDHCKQPADAPAWVNVSILTGLADSAAAAKLVAPTAGLQTARTFLYRGSLDTVYLDGSVNRTEEFFQHYASNSGQVKFVADIPSQHCWPTADPWLSPSTCGTNQWWAPPAMENCGFDGAGQALQHIYDNTLTAPASLAFQHPEYLVAFDQTLYMPAAWPGLSSVGYVYVPPQCASGQTACKLHVSLHGCGMSVWSPNMNTSYVQHTGLNAWADSNPIVVLYPQGGGFIEKGMVAPSAQIQGGCWDGYGQVGWDYAYRTGPQVATIRAMIQAIAGF